MNEPEIEQIERDIIRRRRLNLIMLALLIIAFWIIVVSNTSHLSDSDDSSNDDTTSSNSNVQSKNNINDNDYDFLKKQISDYPILLQQLKDLYQTQKQNQIKSIEQKEQDMNVPESDQIKRIQVLNNIFYSVREIFFEGTWQYPGQLQNYQTDDKVSSPRKLFEKFTESQGLSHSKFMRAYDTDGQIKFYHIQLLITFYDGKYSDGYGAHGSFGIRLPLDLQIGENSAVIRDTAASFTLTNKFKEIKKFEKCDTQIKFQFETTNSALQSGEQQSLPLIKMDGYSADCELNFHTTFSILDTQEFNNRHQHYSIFVSSIAIFQFIVIMKMMKRMIENENENTRYSQISLVWVFCWDGFFAVVHIAASMSRLQFFATPSFEYLILWLVFERNLLVYVWRCRYHVHFHNIDQMRNSFFRFYGKICLALGLFIGFATVYCLEDWFLILANLYLVPQIVHNAVRGQQTQNIDWFYTIGLMALRSVVILYMRGCPSNLLEITPMSDSNRLNDYTPGIKPHPGLCIVITLIVIIQLLIIRYQYYWGPRFFVPSFMLTKQYNYFQDVPENLDLEAQPDSEYNQDCVICFQPLNQAPQLDDNPLGNSTESPFIARFRTRQNQIMKTPCHHKFHIVCLLNWMMIKMDCPTCRTQLPPVE